MKYVKSLVALAFAAFLCATASASLVVDGDAGNKIRTATRAVVVGKTVTVPLYNTKDETYESPSAAELTAGDGGTNETSQAYFSVVVPTNVNQDPQNVVITGIAKTTEPITFKIWKNADHDDTPVEITVKVVAPVENHVGNVKVTSIGAETKEMENGDLLLTFTETGSFSLDGEVGMRRVLLVGGGAAGNNARNTGDYIYGRSGSGAQAYTNSTFIGMPAGDYDVTVGAGALLSYKYEGNEWVLKSSGGVASMITNTTNNGFVTLAAEGGKSAEGWSGTAGIDGEGGTNMWCDITGVRTLYGADAPAATSTKYGTAGAANTGAGGVGGYNGDGVSGGGSGGSGIVVIRLQNPQPVSVEVNQPLTYNGLIQTGVVENAGYTLTGDWYETNASNAWKAVATLNAGYCWKNGSSEKSTNITWSIARAPVTVTPVNTNKVYGTEDPVLPVTVVGTNGLDGIDIAYKIARGDQECVGDYAGTIVVTIEKPIQGNEEGYGNYDVTAGANTTFTIKPADPFKAAVESGAITASVDKAWLDRNVFLETALTPAEMRAKLTETSDGDTLKMWQKYALGMDTNEAFLADAPQNKDAANVTIVAKANPGKYASDIKVQFRVNEGTLQDGVAVDIPVDGTDDPSGKYTMKALFTQEGASYSGDAQPVRNKIGILRKAAYRESGSARELLAVPWTAAMDKDSAVLVSNVVKTACLSQGDKLYVYDTANGNYNGWVLTEENCWQPLSKQIKVSGGKVTQVDESESAADPATATIARGNGIWLEREAATTPVVFVGGADAAAVTLAPAPGMNLMSLDGIGELDIKTKFSAHEGDRVIVPTGDVPAIYTYKDGAWGYDKETETTTTGGKKRIKVERTTEGEMKVGKGAGFWYDRQSAPQL